MLCKCSGNVLIGYIYIGLSFGGEQGRLPKICEKNRDLAPASRGHLFNKILAFAIFDGPTQSGFNQLSQEHYSGVAINS